MPTAYSRKLTLFAELENINAMTLHKIENLIVNKMEKRSPSILN